MSADNLAIMPDGAGRWRMAALPAPPHPAGSDVAVRMMRAPVNPADLLAIDGRYAFALDRDAPIGAEGVGRVEAVGDEVADLRPGDAVMLLSRGNWCRSRVVPRSHLIALPTGMDLDQAAMLRINPPTAWLLIAAARAEAGDVVVQNAAASTVARWVRAIAVRRGITVIDVVRRTSDALPGAVVDGSDLAVRVEAASAGRPIAVALDCVAGPASGRLAECLMPGGRLIVFGHLSGEPVTVRSQLLTGRGLSVHGFSLRPAEAAMGAAARDAMFAELLALQAAVPAPLPIRATLPLARIGEAVAAARAPGAGRVLLDLAS